MPKTMSNKRSRTQSFGAGSGSGGGMNMWSNPSQYDNQHYHNYNPAFDWNAELVRDKYTITMNIGDFRGKVYLHLKKIYRNGKRNNISLEEKDFYDLFENKDLFEKYIDECKRAVTTTYGDMFVDGDANSKQVPFVPIPKSQRTKEMEANQEEARYQADLKNQAIARYMKQIEKERTLENTAVREEQMS